MNLQLTGIHLDITPAIRQHVTTKLERATKNIDGITSINAVLSVEKLIHKIEVTVSLRGKNLFVEAQDQDLYTAVDLVVDKLGRQLSRYKEKTQGHGHDRITEHLDD